jgi:hypothetical protein
VESFLIRVILIIVTKDDFRKLALSLPNAVESAHMGHPDFRVGKKVFATLGYPDDQWAMVALSLVDQDFMVRSEPDVFTPVKGGWGKQGATSVKLRAAKKASVLKALEAAWRNAVEKKKRR